MKKAFSRIFNVFLAVVVLLSSTGFGLVEHSCTVKGKQTSLHKSKNACCANNPHQQQNQQKSTIKKAKCCSEREKYENVDYSSSASQIVAKFTQKSIDWLKVTVVSFVRTIIETILQVITSSTHSSSKSLSTGRDILSFVQSYLI
jgi:hypothetical protein